MNQTVLLTNQEVQNSLNYQKLIPLMRDAFAELSAGTIKILPRSALFQESGNIFAQMAASVPSLGVCGTKIAMFPGPGKFETCQSAVLLFDCDSGALKAIVAAEPITVLRTAASTAAATDVLACPDAEVLCMMGAGRQAVAHAQAICAIRPIREIRIWSNDPASTQSGLEKITMLCPSVSVRGRTEAKDAAADADIVCTVTKAKEPILFGDWLKPGAHVNAVGAVSPFARELDTSVLTRGKVYVDHRETSLGTAGDLLIPIKAGEFFPEQIAGEIGEVINGTCPGRDADSITVFETVGLGVQDVVAAYAALKDCSATHTIDFTC